MRLVFKPSLLSINNEAVYAKGRILIFTDDNHLIDAYNVGSGNWGNGPAPHGIYNIFPVRKLDDDGTRNSFKRDNFPWFAGLDPLFKTNRTGLGIHPDGGIIGTLGCVGVLERDEQLYNFLKNNANLKLYVL